MAIREEKEIQGIQIEKEEVKMSLFVNKMILYIENSKHATKKLLEHISEFSDIAGYKSNMHESVTFLYTNNKLSEREVKETIPFSTASIRIKCLGINLT